MTKQMDTLPPEERLLSAIFGERPEGPRCRSEVNGVTLKQAIEAALFALTPRQIEIIRTRFGFNDPLFHDPTGRGRTLKETGKAFGLTPERIRQIEAKCLRLLRHPSRSRQLKPYLEDKDAQ